MSLFNQFNKMTIIQRQQETKLYEFVMDEIKDGVRHQGSWGKALVNCEGDEQKASAEYIKLRVQELKDYITLNNIIEDERLKAIKQMSEDSLKLSKRKDEEKKANDKKIAKEKEVRIVNEEQNARNLKLISGDHLTMRLIEARDDISYMLHNISICDIFIAGSTGPLHIAGALNKKTIGFYPSKRSSTSLRWETINDFEKKLNFTDVRKNKSFVDLDMNKTILEIQKFISSI